MVVYRSVNGYILSLYWADGPSGLDNLSGYAGTPSAAGDPFAYYTAHDDTHQVVYRAGNGHLYELYWPGVAPVSGWDLMHRGRPGGDRQPRRLLQSPARTPSTSSTAPPTAGCTRSGGCRAAGRRRPCRPRVYGTPKSADRPAAFTVEGPNTQHVAYRGTNNHIYEAFW